MYKRQVFGSLGDPGEGQGVSEDPMFTELWRNSSVPYYVVTAGVDAGLIDQVDATGSDIEIIPTVTKVGGTGNIEILYQFDAVPDDWFLSMFPYCTDPNDVRSVRGHPQFSFIQQFQTADTVSGASKGDLGREIQTATTAVSYTHLTLPTILRV